MTELTFKKVSSRYQAMGNAMGITTGMIADATDRVADKLNQTYDLYETNGSAMGSMSRNLTRLAADMASFYNVDQENVAEALNAVYTGQTRPLRQYGIDLTQATLQEWANKQGIDAKIQSMTQAEKTMLRYQYVMANTSTVQSDFLRTQSTWANQVRILKQNLQALASVVGGTLINAFKPFVTALNAAMSSVISFAETVGNALGKIFGWKILHTPASNAADAFNTLSEGLEDAGTSGDDAAGGIEKAAKAAQEYKNTVLGFDELNKLNDIPDPTGSGGSGGGSGSGGGAGGVGAGDGSGADFQLVKADSWLEDYKSDIDSLYELGSYISGVLTGTLESIEWDKVYEGARNFGTGLADFLNGLITPELFSATAGFVAGAINTVLNAQDAFLDKFDFKNLGKSIAAGVNRFFNDFDFGLASSVFYKAVNGIADTIKSAADEIKWNSIGTKISTCIKEALGGIKWVEKVYPAAESFGSGLAEFLNGLINEDTFATIGDSVASALNTALKVLNTFGNTFNFKNFGSSIAAAVRRFFYTWDPVLTADTFNKLAQGILDAIKSAVTGVKWFDVGYKIRTAIININWGNLMVSLGSTVIEAINAAIDLAIGLFDGTPISDAFETVKTTVNNIANAIDFETLKTGLQGVWDIGSKFVTGFMEGFTGAMGVLADIGIGVLSGIAFAINWLADGLNKLDPDLVKNIGTALGIVAASMGAINLAKGAVDTIGNLVGKFLGMGGAAATAAEAATTVATETGKTTGKIRGLAGELITSVGAFEAFGIYGAVKAGAWLEMAGEKAQGYNGYLTEMGGVMTTVARQFAPEMSDKITDLNNDLENSGATTNEAVDAFVKFFKGEHVDYKDLQYAIIGARADITLTAEQADLLDGIMKLMGTDTEGTAKKIGGFAGSVGTAKKDIEKNSSGIRDSLGTALDTIGTKAEGADKKSDTFKTNIWGFAGGIAAQALLMAVMGATFGTMGDKAEGAETPIENLKTTVSNFVADVATNAETAKKNAESVGENTGQGVVDGITAKTEELKAAIKSVTVDTPQDTMTSLWGINSPSTVTYGYGENIIDGLKNALSDKSSGVVTIITTLITSMQNEITGKYDEFRTAGRNLADSFKSGFSEVSFSSLTQTIWDSIDFRRLYSNFETAGGNAMDKFAQGMYNSNVKTPQLSFTQTVSGSGTNQTTSWSSRLSWRAKGGFPNLGELFVAGENGPEMVGKMGNRNVVANNIQIAEGIKAAVVDGMMEVAMSGAFGRGDRNEQPIVVNATLRTENDEILARAVERGMAKRNDRFNPVAGYAY